MNRYFAYLLLILVGLQPLSTFSTELSQRTGIRQRIQSALEKKVCRDIVAQASPTRGISRGLPRQSRSSQIYLPLQIQEYSNRYAQVIQAEFDLPYGFEHDPKSYFFFKNDPYEGAAKLQIYRQMGYEWMSPGAPSRTLTWIELAMNHWAYIQQKGLDPNKSWRPALVLYKKIGTTVDPITKKVVEKFDYLLIDPLTEPFPADIASWSVLTKDVQFNIPFHVILAGMKERKFPLMDANHDFNHFISGLRFPELTAALIDMIQKAKPEDITLGFKRRQYWLTEALSVLDPAGFESNQRFLKAHGRSLTPARELKNVETELLKMNEKALLQYALELARYFESQLRDVSGGNSNAAEKWYYLSESFGMKAQDLLTEDFSNAAKLDRIVELSKAYFENGPITLNANPKKMTNETATFNFNTFITSQKLLALLLTHNGKPQIEQLGLSRGDALKYLVQFISRTELMLQNKPATYSEWAEGFLQADLPVTNRLAQLLLQVFGNDIVRDIYLGAGKKRAD